MFGDGSATIISTPGQTPGHQSLLVHLPKTGWLVLSGDAVHFKDNWDNKRVASMNTSQVRPVLEGIIDWTESHPEPGLHEYSAERHHWRHIWDSRFTWYQTLGLRKWLSRADAAEAEFAKAIKAEIDASEYALKETIALDPGDEQAALAEHVATALAARNPAVGLKLLAAVGVAHASEPEAPVLEFSQWACHYLVIGGKQDAKFVERGAEMLQATLLPYFFWTANRTEPALWLKAIYWDTGVARTPEQAIARAYDSMPGIERPDFVPR